MRAIAFIDALLQGRLPFEFPGATLDSALCVFLGHIGAAGLIQDQAQAKVGVWVRSTFSSSNGQFVAYLGEQLAALGISSALGALDSGPLAMSRHPYLPVEPASMHVSWQLYNSTWK